MSPRDFLQSPSPRHSWPRSVWPRKRVFPLRHARSPAIQLVNYLLTPESVPAHRLAVINAMQVLAVSIVYERVVELALGLRPAARRIPELTARLV